MSEILVRKELIHKSPGYKDEKFIEDIDATGGWPVGFKFVSFYHSLEYEGRYCKFGNRYLREPFWTTVISADDYYWAKMSDEAKKKVTNAARKQLINQLR